MTIRFDVGEKFASLADLEKKIVDYQRTMLISGNAIPGLSILRLRRKVFRQIKCRRLKLRTR